MKTKVTLTTTEREGACWQKVEAEMQSRLETYRKKAENPHEPESERLGAAWRISELKELLALGDEPKK